MPVQRFLGVDLAWGEGNDGRRPNETGYAVLDETGRILDAGWARGVEETTDWIRGAATPGSVTAIDAPLVVHNATGMRECEREVGRAYGRWQVYANASNSAMGWQAGVAIRVALESAGFVYLDGGQPAPGDARTFFECYPYTTLVGMSELGYDVERPRYKRLVPGLPASTARAERAKNCDELIRRMAALSGAVPPLDLRSHPIVEQLVLEPSPSDQVAHKHREDLLDAVICAWTAAIWSRYGQERMQILGAGEPPDPDGRRATILAPARPEQRVGALRRPRPRTAPASPAVVMDVLDEVLVLLRRTTEVDDAFASRLTLLRREIDRLTPKTASEGA